MFTGIIEELGKVTAVSRGSSSSFIQIQAELILNDIHTGDSIAVNGVCLTVTEFDKKSFRADVMNETLERSSLGSLKIGSPVNLERAMSSDGRFGGHIVSGHIDGTGIVSKIKNDGIAVRYTITTSPEILRLIVEKGSVAIDGISLTVTEVTDTYFSVSIIPHTLAKTVLSLKKVGDTVNLENDIIGKYVEKLMKCTDNTKKSNLSREFLAEHGF
jgi:riboflavin synthase